MTKSQGWLAIILLLGIIAFLVWWWKWDQARRVELPPPPELTAELQRALLEEMSKLKMPVDNGDVPIGEPAPLVRDASGKIDTTSWPVYRNEQYGFEIKYPPGLGVQNVGTDIHTPERIFVVYFKKVQEDSVAGVIVYRKGSDVLDDSLNAKVIIGKNYDYHVGADESFSEAFIGTFKTLE
ncbi:MAG: hypothetical protein AAB468_01965 [Patescibacteria group bacterium]